MCLLHGCRQACLLWRNGRPSQLLLSTCLKSYKGYISVHVIKSNLVEDIAVPAGLIQTWTPSLYIHVFTMILVTLIRSSWYLEYAIRYKFVCLCISCCYRRDFEPLLVHGQVTIIFVVSVCLFVCLCRVFLSRLRSDLDQTRTYVTCLGLVVSPRI